MNSPSADRSATFKFVLHRLSLIDSVKALKISFILKFGDMYVAEQARTPSKYPEKDNDTMSIL